MLDTTTQPIKVVQLNMNRHNGSAYIALNTLIGIADILLCTEPWFDNIGNGQRGLAAHPYWQPILPVQALEEDSRPRVMAYVAKRHDFTVTLRSDMANDLDIQILQIHQHPHPPTILVNVYNQTALHGNPVEWTVDRLKPIQLPDDQPVIITGDWNTHHSMWEDLPREETRREKEFVDWIHEEGLIMMNERNVPTYQSHDGDSLSTLDLTFINGEAQRYDTVREWCVDDSLSCSSDHYAIR